jgi:hypothetical protein
MGVAHIYFYFTEFEVPFTSGKISKRDILRAIDEATLPNNISPLQVNEMFGTLETLNFQGFAGLLVCQRIFHRFSKKMVTGERRLELEGW